MKSTILSALITKDLKNFRHSLVPALLLGLPLILLLGFISELDEIQKISWRSALWLSFFVSSTTLFYRSFAVEHRFNIFHLYTIWRVPKTLVFFSQACTQALGCFILGLFYFGFCWIFFSPQDSDVSNTILSLLIVSASLAPLGSFLGLLLQWEREILFSLFFLPLASPLVLAAYHLSADMTSSWLYLSLSFLVAGSFASAFFFEFFFDELTQTH